MIRIAATITTMSLLVAASVGAQSLSMERRTDGQYGAPPASSDRVPISPQPQVASPAVPRTAAEQRGGGRPSGPLQEKLSPGMAALTDDVLYGDVWRRPELSPRDRSLITVTLLIATGKTAPLAGHLARALDNGVRPSEASGLLAHLAVYAGWPCAVAALEVYDQVYTSRKIDTARLRESAPRLVAPPSDAARAKALTDTLGTIAPKFVQLTNDVVFGDLWRRSDLSVRDRSLVTIVALAALGDDDQLESYVRLGIESGLTRDQIVEAVTHLAFYVGWSKATKALSVLAKAVVGK